MESPPGKGLVAVCVVALLLSGCSAKPPPATSNPPSSVMTPTMGPTLPPTINRSVDLFSLKPEMVGCQFFTVSFDAPKEDVQAQLPPGYEAENIVSSTAQVNVDVHRCDSIVVNNETVLPSIVWVHTFARVLVNDTLAGGAGAHFFALEMFVENQTLANLFRALGFNVTMAALAFEKGDPTSTVRVTVASDLWYDIQSGNGFGRPVTYSRVHRIHQVSDGGTPLWFNRNHTFAFPELPGTGTAKVMAGALSKMGTGKEGVILGSTSALATNAKATISFGHL